MFYENINGRKVNESFRASNVTATELDNLMVLSVTNDTHESVEGETIMNFNEKNNVLSWPGWAHNVKCISHFLLTLYSSVSFLIYYIKQKTSGPRG